MERRDFIIGAVSLVATGPALASIDVSSSLDERKQYPDFDWDHYDRWIESLKKMKLYLIRQSNGEYRVEHPMTLQHLLNPGVPVGIVDEDDSPVKKPCMMVRSSSEPLDVFYVVSKRDAFALMSHPKLCDHFVLKETIVVGG